MKVIYKEENHGIIEIQDCSVDNIYVFEEDEETFLLKCVNSEWYDLILIID